MARSAVKKLDTVTEGRQSTYFENIFKTTIPSRQVLSSRHEPLSEESDTDIQALDQVIYVMKSIVSLREIEDRPSSNVRFYCDNDGVKRWRPMSDLDAEIIEPNGVPNSKRKRRQGKILQDLLNGNVMKTRGCDLYGNSIAGFSYSVTDGKGAMLDQERMNWQLEKLPWLIENFKDQPSLRATISICTPLLRPAKGKTRVISDMSEDERKDSIDNVDFFGNSNEAVGFIILHELIHFPFRALDWIDDKKLPNGLGAYGFDEILRLASSKEALGNADNYAWFGLLSYLLDLGLFIRVDEREDGHDGGAIFEDGYLDYEGRWARVQAARKAEALAEAMQAAKEEDLTAVRSPKAAKSAKKAAKKVEAKKSVEGKARRAVMGEEAKAAN